MDCDRTLKKIKTTFRIIEIKKNGKENLISFGCSKKILV